MYLNKAFIIGNLIRDPELKALPSGTKVCSFSIASNRLFKDKDGNKQEVVEFHNIVSFAKLGELAGQYLKKGQQVLVEGRIQTRSWETNGEKKYRTEIVADNIQFGMRSSGTAASAKVQASESEVPKEGSVDPATEGSAEKIAYPSEEINPDDIPF